MPAAISISPGATRTADRGRSGFVIRGVDRQLIETLSVSNPAVCTSGDYERRSPGDGDGHHILDPRTGASRERRGQRDGRRAHRDAGRRAGDRGVRARSRRRAFELLERQGVDGLIVSPTLERFATRRLARCLQPM